MNVIKKFLISVSFIFFIAAPVMTVAAPQVAVAGPACEMRLIGLVPPWYRGLTDNDCNIVSPDSLPGGLATFIWSIVLNIIEIGLFLVGFVTLFFIIFGGFLYLTGGANPSQIERAKKTLINATVGFVISTAAIGVVNLIFGVLK